MLWRVRTTLADRPGALAAIAQRCGQARVNILALQIFPGERGVTDELVLRSPAGWGLADVAALVEESGGRHVSVTRCTAHALTDAPTQYVRAAIRLVEDPRALQAVLDDLLDAEEWTGELGALHDRLEVQTGRGGTRVQRLVPFTAAERARAAALGELTGRVLARGAAAGPDDEGAAAAPEVAGGPGPAGPPGRRHESPPTVRLARMSDTAAVTRMHERCSPDALQRRYHAPTPRLTWRSVRRLIAPDEGGSLVAVAGSEVVGMAVVAPYDRRVMELGLLVEDRWQRRGIGSSLLHQAARLAVRHGAEDLLCVMRTDNQAVLPTVQRTGLTCRLRAGGGTVEVRIPLAEVPPMDVAAVAASAEATPLAQEAPTLR